MAQVTQALIDNDFKSAIAAGKCIPATVNEQRQLIYAWEQWRKVRARTAYPMFCKHPEKCCNTGRCEAGIVCND